MANDPNLTGLYYYDQIDAPQNVRGLTLNNESIRVSWDPPIGGHISGYEVYRAYTKDLVYVKVADTEDTSLVISGLERNNTYYFSVKAVIFDSGVFEHLEDRFGYIQFGYDFFAPVNEDCVISGVVNKFSIGGAEPSLVRVISNGKDTTSLNIIWQAPLNTGTIYSGYRIWRTTDWGGQFSGIGSTINLNYIDSGLENRSYYYRVTSLY